MNIESIDLFHVAVAKDGAIADESGMRASESVLVCLKSGDLWGWGEASPGTAPQDRQQWAGAVLPF